MDSLSSTLIAAGAAVAVAVLIYAINLGRAASGMHAEQSVSIDRLERERNEAWQRRDEALGNAERRRATEHERDQLKAELATIKANSEGIDLSASEMKFSWEKQSDWPQGVVAILDLNRLVNRNNHDVSLEISLVAPIWRLGTFTTTTSSPALIKPLEGLTATIPRLPPLINIPKKQGHGPSYMVFFFGYEGWKTFPFIPDSHRNVSFERFAELVTESELYLSIYDRANNIRYPDVLAPGTLEKKRERLQREKSNDEPSA